MFDTKTVKNSLTATVDWLRKEYVQLSTGRAHPSLIDSVSIEVYGDRQPIKNIATITTEDARTLRISPWDKSAVGDIHKALQTSGLPYSFSADSEGVRLTIPMLTAENKTALMKVIKAKLEDARISVREARTKLIKEIDASDVSDDQKKANKDTVQKAVDEINAELETLCVLKEKELQI